VSAEPTMRYLKMTDDLWDALDAIAALNDRNVADEIRVACVDHLARNGVTVTPDLVVSGRGRRGGGRRR
jgi:hypothetical protein